MKLELKFTVGETELRIEEEVASHGELFSKLEFWSSIPRKGPNGETDLKFVHRVHQGFDFYEVVCEKAGMRFPFGQRKEPKGVLFPKGWEPLYGQEGEDGQATPASPSNFASEGQLKRMTQLVEDIVAQNVRRESIIAKIQQAVGRGCELKELTSDESGKIITLLSNRLTEIKASRQQKAGVA